MFHIFFVILDFLDQRKEGSVLFNDALNTFSYSYMASDIYGKGPFR